MYIVGMWTFVCCIELPVALRFVLDSRPGRNLDVPIRVMRLSMALLVALCALSRALLAGLRVFP